MATKIEKLKYEEQDGCNKNKNNIHFDLTTVAFDWQNSLVHLKKGQNDGDFKFKLIK